MAQENLNIKQREEIIQQDIKSIVSDLTFLSESNFLHEYIADKSKINQHRTEDTFLIFALNKKKYDQLRFINSQGMEEIRINWNYGKPEIISKEQLQNKRKRYYFQDTISLQRGEIFVSPFDLNIEQDKIENPLKPMIRFGTPVFNQDGEKTGIVILNFLGKQILSDMSKLDKHSAGDILLLNKKSFYLRGINPDDEWGFMYPEKNNINFATQYPMAWQKISIKGTGQIVTSKGLFSFITIHPLFEGLHSSTGSPAAFESSKARLSGKAYTWKLVSFIPSDLLNNILHPHFTTYIWGNIVLLLVMGFGCWMIADAAYRRKETEKELKNEREKFRTVADFTHDWEYWVDPDGRYVYISPSCERITGYNPKKFEDNPDFLLKIIHPEDFQKMNIHINSGMTAKNDCTFDFRIIAASGEVKWIAHVCQAVYSEDGTFLGRRSSNRDISQRKKAELELEGLATHDVLTGLPNRKLLYERLAQILAQAERSGNNVAILFVDLDKFKNINDELGHDAGDIVLIETTRRMISALRKGDTVARIGGDEFVIIIPDAETDSTVNIIAQKLIDIIGRDIEIEKDDKKENRNVGASIGISIYPKDGNDIDSLIKTADTAMYEAKKSGRNQYFRL